MIGSDAALRIYHHDGLTWRGLTPDRLVPAEADAGEMNSQGILTINEHNDIFLITCVRDGIVVLHSNCQGEQFRLLPIFPPDDALSHVGLTLERSTGYNVVDVPFALFSMGEKGPDCFGEGICHQVRAVQLRLQSPGELEIGNC